MSPELSALVERVALAMHVAVTGDTEPCQADAHIWQREALAAIRAVAEATREPSAAMMRAAVSRAHGRDDEPLYASIWRAMHAASPLGEALRDG